MSPMPAAAAAVLPAEPSTITAFDPSMMQAGQGAAGPEAMGQALLSGMNRFTTHEAHFQSVVQQAAGAAPANDGSAGAPDVADPIQPQSGVPAPTAMQQGAALQQKSMGLMMQTYSFALEATMVTNAATTFTSSINTLIKTQ